MARTGLGVACPNCDEELSIEGGLAAERLRQAIRLRAVEAKVWIECDNCGSDIVLGPESAEAIRPVRGRPLEEVLRESAERSARLQRLQSGGSSSAPTAAGIGPESGSDKAA